MLPEGDYCNRKMISFKKLHEGDRRLPIFRDNCTPFKGQNFMK